MLPVGNIFDELQEALQETDSDLGDDPDGLDPDADHQELLQPVEWLQPSCSSGGTYSADADARSTETEGEIECPTCFKQFPIDAVSLHADECADAFWERVGGESEITQPRPQGLLAFQYGGGSGEDPGTQQNHVTKISNEDGNVFKMAAKAK